MSALNHDQFFMFNCNRIPFFSWNLCIHRNTVPVPTNPQHLKWQVSIHFTWVPHFMGDKQQECTTRYHLADKLMRISLIELKLQFYYRICKPFYFLSPDFRMHSPWMVVSVPIVIPNVDMCTVRNLNWFETNMYVIFLNENKCFNRHNGDI